MDSLSLKVLCGSCFCLPQGECAKLCIHDKCINVNVNFNKVTPKLCWVMCHILPLCNAPLRSLTVTAQVVSDSD